MVSLGLTGAARALTRGALAAPTALVMNGRYATGGPPGYYQPSVWLAIEYTQDLQLPQDAKSRLQTLLKQEKVCYHIFNFLLFL